MSMNFSGFNSGWNPFHKLSGAIFGGGNAAGGGGGGMRLSGRQLGKMMEHDRFLAEQHYGAQEKFQKESEKAKTTRQKSRQGHAEAVLAAGLASGKDLSMNVDKKSTKLTTTTPAPAKKTPAKKAPAKPPAPKPTPPKPPKPKKP